jgi:hypothetical protein
VSSTKLGGDWVLAESEQVAVQCTTDDVLRAYLSGDLQQRWNMKEVLQCKIKCMRETHPRDHYSTDNTNTKTLCGQGRKVEWIIILGGGHSYYQQDLVLRPQRIIRSGVMRYSQTITSDKIGDENYIVYPSDSIQNSSQPMLLQ